MNKKMYNQQGSAHVVVVVILVIVLVTALGWIFWQNFIYEEPKVIETGTTTVMQDKESDESANPLYSDNDVSFEYLADTWTTKNDTMNGKALVTTDYKEFELGAGFTPEVGAVIAVDKTALSESNQFKKPGGEEYASDVKEVTIAGNPGYVYKQTNEGIRHRAIFSANGYIYGISLSSSAQDTLPSSHQAGFDLAVKSARL